MIYPFQASDGQMIELEYAPDDAPAIGTVVVAPDGRTCRRVASMPQIHGTVGNFPRFESTQLPRWWKHHKGEFSPIGKPRYSNRQEVEEDMARARHDGTQIEYGSL